MIRFFRQPFVCCLRTGRSFAFGGLLISPIATASALPATVTLGNLSQTYDGSAKIPDVATLPIGLPSQIVYRNLSPNAPPPVSEVVYNDCPNPLALSYLSYSFHGQSLTALGNYIQLGATARKIESCDTILVTWAKASDWPALAAANPAGYYHPITLFIYEVKSTNDLVFRTEATQSVLVPWKPIINPDGSPNNNNGFAFQANIPFPSGIILPERVLVMVSYNTQAAGFSPTGSDGPYNSLNVALKNTYNIAPVGADVNADLVLQIRNGIWYYPSSGWTATSAPMVRLNASSEETITLPTNAATWRATARVSNADYDGTANAILTIQPAVATVTLDHLTQVADGTPKSVAVSTSPPNLPWLTTYGGSTSLPTAIGKYAVHTVITDPNYQGLADGELWLGNNFQSWISPWVVSGSIPASAVGGNEDPDQDSISNLMEYALALNPSTANHGLPDLGLPRADYSSGQLSIIYRKNLTATDLNYQVEVAVEPGNMESWFPAISTSEVLATEGSVQTIRTTLQAPTTDPRHFLRLKVTRQGSP